MLYSSPMEYYLDQELDSDTFLLRHYSGASNSALKKLYKQGKVAVDGSYLQHNTRLKPGQTLQLFLQKKFLGKIPLLYEDESIVVVDKPEGLLSVATDKEGFNTLHAFLKKHYGRVWPVHRLDRETSGVMIFALTDETKELLKEQFMKHTIYREYYGIVQGRLEGKGTWQHYLVEDKNFHVHVHPRDEGELAITHYEVVKNTPLTTSVKFVLKTGKKNQIRVQASHMGHPILGDKKYGEVNQKADRLYLHAHKLSFIHPYTKKTLSFISPKRFT